MRAPANERGERAAADPLACPHATDERVDHHILCALHNAWVDCQVSHFGEPPACAYEEPDNGDEAAEARLEWLRSHKDTNNDGS